MSKMKDCSVCGQPRSAFILNNKTVCLKCDELLLDLEIEADDAPLLPSDRRQERGMPQKPVVTPTIKKQ